ncbi:MAG: hypothetical protein ACREIC_28510, partial [Limisphaerales bacterium]
MTPAKLELMTDVGPPDWATNKFPTNSAIIFPDAFLVHSEISARSNLAPLPKWNAHVANPQPLCQSDSE